MFFKQLLRFLKVVQRVLKRNTVESYHIMHKCTCLTSQNKAVHYFQALLQKALKIADKYLSCRLFHGKFSLQINSSF